MLTSIDKEKYYSFSTSINIAKKIVEISENATRFATYESCCKLYNPKDLSTKKARQSSKILCCIYVEFLTHSNTSKRALCSAILSKKVKIKDGITRKPLSIYPVVDLKQQFLKLFQQSGFEEVCRKWTYQLSKTQLLDIYNGRI